MNATELGPTDGSISLMFHFPSVYLILITDPRVRG